MASSKLLRFEDLKERGIVRNRTQLGRLVARNNFPSGFNLSPNARVWDEVEILDWLSQRRASSSR
jgi:predicted DNA-binding transcriptional regulator AlpA